MWKTIPPLGLGACGVNWWDDSDQISLCFLKELYVTYFTQGNNVLQSLSHEDGRILK